MHEQLAESSYKRVQGWELNSRPLESQVQPLSACDHVMLLCKTFSVFLKTS